MSKYWGDEWWRYYKERPNTNYISQPLPNAKAVFEVGQKIRLKGKPEKARRILEVKWHTFRHEFVYIVETGYYALYPGDDAIYWFAPQLELVD